MAQITTIIETWRDGALIDTRTETREETAEEVAERVYTTELAAMLAELIAAQDALTAALPNNAFAGARELKTYVRATRRALRAVNRDLAALDPGA